MVKGLHNLSLDNDIQGLCIEEPLLCIYLLLFIKAVNHILSLLLIIKIQLNFTEVKYAYGIQFQNKFIVQVYLEHSGTKNISINMNLRLHKHISHVVNK